MAIALWGPTYAGKTAFLAQLYLRHQALARGWDVFPTGESDDFLTLVRSRLNANRFPEPTDKAKNVKYMFKHISGKEAILFVEDRAGHESTALDDEGKARVNKADGLVLLFDPTRRARELEEQIELTLRELHIAGDRGLTKDRRPIAVCLSKADYLIESPADLRYARDNPREFVLEKVSKEILTWVGRFASNFEIFPISALGIRIRHGVVQPATFYDEVPELRVASGTEPLNLIAPFEWLFSQIEGRQAE